VYLTAYFRIVASYGLLVTVREAALYGARGYKRELNCGHPCDEQSRTWMITSLGVVTSARCSLQFGNILRRAEAAALVKSRPVVVFGEMVAVLWAQKKYDAAIRLEELWNELSLTCSFYLCCAYLASGFGGTLKGEPCATICAQHSEVVFAF
jgi:hypothetical protein